MGLRTCVVMATYNGVEHIEEQIRSFFAQTILPDLLVVRDDNSLDGTVEELVRLSKISPFPIKIIRGRYNLGYIKNFAEALKNSNADIYFYSDQDDVWLPRKIQEHLKIYEQLPSVLSVISNQEIVGSNLETSGKTSLEEICKVTGNNLAFVHGCCTSFRHQLHGVACRPQEGLAHDDWVHAIAEVCGQRYVIDEPLQLFRRHSNTTTRSAFNAFERNAKSKSKRLTTSAQVAKNLRQRAKFFQAIASELNSLLDLPLNIREKGVEISQMTADRASSRAYNLERGVAGIPQMVRDAILGRQRFQQTIADIVRVVLSLFTRSEKV